MPLSRKVIALSRKVIVYEPTEHRLRMKNRSEIETDKTSTYIPVDIPNWQNHVDIYYPASKSEPERYNELIASLNLSTLPASVNFQRHLGRYNKILVQNTK
jgi:hypothetical protein